LGDDGLAIFLAHIAFDKGAAHLPAMASPLSTCMSAMTTCAAFGREHARGSFTQARCAAGDDEYLARNVHGVLLDESIDVNVNVNYHGS
jgi:hypothetical protein